MEKNRLIPYLLIVALLFLGCVAPIVQVQANHNEPLLLFEIEPFIDGSNQEWAIEILSMSDNSKEKIRYYDFLLHAYTYLMRYDEQDYMREYYDVKELWLGWIENYPNETAEQQDAHHDIEQMLEDEAWAIDIFYPVERPFALTHDESTDVFFTFVDANPQFMSHPMFAQIIPPVGLTCDDGITPGITVLAYWAFAERRQGAYEYFIDTFEPIPWEPGRHLGEWSDHPIIIHVSPDQIETTGVRELEGAEEPGGNNVLTEDSENHQGQTVLRRNLILLSTLGALLLLATTIFVTKRKKTSRESEIRVDTLEDEKQETESNARPMVTVTCNFCGARVNVVIGKSQKCPYCDCIVSGVSEG